MAEIFLSYQKKDRDLAQRMDDALSKAGFNVWWDDDIDPRENWDLEIQREIEKARFVLVLWTRNSVRSEWVKIEAMEAKESEPSKLRQVRFDDCKIPLAFKFVHYIDLSRDRPERHQDWAKLLRWLDPGEGRKAAERPTEPNRESGAAPRQAEQVGQAENLEQAKQARQAEARSPHGVLTILVMVLFALIVGYGWAFGLFARTADPVPALLLAVLVGWAGLLLARRIGSAISSDGAGPGFRSGVALYYYAALFFITVTGTLNAVFYTFEGNSVLRQAVDDAERELGALENAAAPILRRANQRTGVAAEVVALLIQLRAETTNPLNCGVGAAARTTLGRIDTILPGFRNRSAGSDPQSCDAATLERRYADYEATALAMLGLDRDRRMWSALRIAMDGPVASARLRLAQAEAGLAETWAVSGRGYSNAQLALEDAASAYAVARDRLVAAHPDAAGLDAAIDLSPARNLGVVTALPAMLAARLGYLSTWLYLIIATALDLVLVFLFAQTLRPSIPRGQHKDDDGQDLQFLWVNEGT